MGKRGLWVGGWGHRLSLRLQGFSSSNLTFSRLALGFGDWKVFYRKTSRLSICLLSLFFLGCKKQCCLYYVRTVFFRDTSGWKGRSCYELGSSNKHCVMASWSPSPSQRLHYSMSTSTAFFCYHLDFQALDHSCTLCLWLALGPSLLL